MLRPPQRAADASAPDMRAARRAAGQQGQITTAAAARLRARAQRAVAVRVAQRVSCIACTAASTPVGHAAVTAEGRCMAAVLACGEQRVPELVCSAGMLASRRLLPREERLPHVTVVGHQGPSASDGVERPSRALAALARRHASPRDPRDRRPTRTLLDLAAVLSLAARCARAARRGAGRAPASRVRQLLEVHRALATGTTGAGALRAVDRRLASRRRAATSKTSLLDLLDAGGHRATRGQRAAALRRR